MASKYSTARAPGREHIPLFPKGYIAVPIIQLVLAVITLAMSAYSMSLAVMPVGIAVLVTVSSENT